MKIKPIASGSTGNAYLISDGASEILLDIGVPYSNIQKATSYRASRIAGCLVTHRHGDHTKGAKEALKRGMNIYAPEDTISFLGGPTHRAHIAENRKVITIGTWRVMPFEVKHDVPCFGYIARSTKLPGESLCYITDAQYSSLNFKGITHWIVEANFSEEITRENLAEGCIDLWYKDRVWHTHMSIESLEKMLEKSDLTMTQQIYLAHMSDKNSNESEFIDRIKKLTGAEVYACN